MSDFYVFRCCKCGHIQVKEIRSNLSVASFKCFKCEKSTKIHDAKKGKINLDYYGAFDCRVAQRVCTEWKQQGKIPEFVQYLE